jgi:flagellar biosynthesis anti-sigma factor FlgM
VNVTPSNPQRSSAPGPSSDAGQAARAERASAATSPSSAAQAGNVDLSAEARAYLRLRSRLESLPQPGHEARIARLRAAIEAGTYAVGGEQIAAAMLRDTAVAGMLGLAPRP